MEWADRKLKVNGLQHFEIISKSERLGGISRAFFVIE